MSGDCRTWSSFNKITLVQIWFLSHMDNIMQNWIHTYIPMDRCPVWPPKTEQTKHTLLGEAAALRFVGQGVWRSRTPQNCGILCNQFYLLPLGINWTRSSHKQTSSSLLPYLSNVPASSNGIPDKMVALAFAKRGLHQSSWLYQKSAILFLRKR